MSTYISHVLKPLALATSTIVLLAGCDVNDTESNVSIAGELINNETVIAKQTASELINTYNTHSEKVSTASLESLVGKPKCDIKVHKISFQTKGVQNEEATSTAAVIMPSGDNPICKGDRPIVLHAHGTAVSKDFDFSKVGSKTNEAGLRSAMMAAMYAAQGYIVIAPNYIGYGGSSLDYNAYLHADQQSSEMKHALQAGRTALKNIDNIGDNGKLFLTGYSQGGYVAMATARKFQLEGIKVTAAAPMSGPYAMAAFGDVIFSGKVNVGGTIFGPLISKSYQKAYGNIYQNKTDIYNPKYEKVESFLPGSRSFDQLIASGDIPLSALFQKAPTGINALDQIPLDPKFSYGFDDDNYLITSAFRAKYLADAQANPDGLVPTQQLVPVASKTANNTFRQALAKNDLRGYIPTMPVYMCGGHNDPVVFYDVNVLPMAGIFNARSATFAQLDLDLQDKATREEKGILATNSNGLSNEQKTSFENTATSVQTKFAQDVGAIMAAIEAQQQAKGLTTEQAKIKARQLVAQAYHSYLAAPYCAVAAKEIFDTY